jgi:hypothetical protein
MDTELRDTRQRADAPSHRSDSYFSARERLAISALVTAITLWIRVVEVLPDNRHHR